MGKGAKQYILMAIKAYFKIIISLLASKNAILYVVGFYEKNVYLEWLILSTGKMLKHKVIYEARNGRLIKAYEDYGKRYKEDIEIFAQILDRILDANYQERVQENIDLQLELERLENQRKQLQFLRRIKTAQVSLMIRTAWMNRNHTAGRSNTGAVTDPMLLSIPTPPTSEAANRSLGCGGNMLAYI